MQNTFPSEAQVQQQAEDLQARFQLSDAGLANVLDWVSETEELEAEGEEKLMAWYLENGMTYQAAKAIDEDPYEWIRSQLKEELGLAWLH